MKKVLKTGTLCAIGYLLLGYGMTIGYTCACEELWNKKLFTASDELVDTAENTFRELPKWYVTTCMKVHREENKN